MSALSTRLEQLLDDVGWFARATELRLHLIQADPSLHEPVVRIVTKGARLSDHPVPYLYFAEPFVGPEAGWKERQATLDEAYAVICEALAQRGKPVEAPPAEPSGGTHGAFAGRLLRWVLTTETVLKKPVVILAPVAIESPERLTAELLGLVNESRLGEVRWVVVVPEPVALPPLVEPLGAAVLVTNCLVPPEDVASDLDKMAANAAAAAKNGSTGWARAGMAWPSVAPPPDKFAPELTAEDLAREKVRLCLMQSASLMQRSKGAEAIAPLREAHQECVRAGLVDERLAVHLMMASNVASVGDARLAIRELDAVRAEATTLARPQFALQAAQTKAAMQAGTGDIRGAITTYSDAIGIAREVGEPARPMLIELLRTLGQLSLSNGSEQQALGYWREALTVAEAAPAGADLGSAPEAARAMAAVYRARGQWVQAESLEQQAAQLEAAPMVAAEAEAAAAKAAHA